MACRYTYQGKTYEAHEFDDVLRAMEPADAAKYMPGIASIPSAPFVTDTKAWVALALKRMIRYAAENGFDRIAWTNGEQQAARYDLSKQVDRVAYNERTGTLMAWPIGASRGTIPSLMQKVPIEDVGDYIGKDAAEKLVAAKSNNQIKEISGIDLKVGGEGMKGFYDKIVPTVANDVLKKFGGGKVGVVEIATHGKRPVVMPNGMIHPTKTEQITLKQPGFDITPEMRAKVMEGQPLFSKGQDRIDFTHEILRELATEDALFRYPKSTSATVKGVFHDVFPGVMYYGEHTRADERGETGADHRYVLQTPERDNGDKGVQFHVMTTDDGRVWIDVHEFKPGDQGSRVYAAVANYAYNSGKVFVGDPNGVSREAVIARTRAMLSSALRFGTTHHLMAAKEQEHPSDPKIEPLVWRGNDIEKTHELIHTFIATIHNFFPELKGYRYDFRTRQFIDRSGRPVGADRFILAGRDPRAREAGAGPTALRAAILIESLISGEGSSHGDGGILKAVLDGSAALTADHKAGLGSLFSQGDNYLDNFKDEARSPRKWFDNTLDRAASALKGSDKFGWLDKSVHTQLHKAQKNKYFGEVFRRVQIFMSDASRAALRPAEMAPTVLPRIDVSESIGPAFRALFKGKKASADIDAAFASALRGTLEDRVYKDAESAGLTPEQFSLYREFRDSIDASLDELSASEAWALARPLFLNAFGRMTNEGQALKKATLDNPAEAGETLLGHIQSMLDEAKLRAQALTDKAYGEAPFIEKDGDPLDLLRAALSDDTGNAQQNKAIAEAIEAIEAVNALTDTANKMAKIFSRRDQLQREGYAPLMRFGQYYLTITRTDPLTGERMVNEETGEPETEFFGLFESEAERDRAIKAFKEEYGDSDYVDFDSGTMSEEEWRRYKGVSPETVALFAGNLGIDTDTVFQEWYRKAVANRSALKRLIHRKGTPGFSTDGSRVLASFLTSNGRRSSMLYHVGDIQESIDAFPKQMGVEKDEAIRLADYIQNPEEEANTARSLMFMHFLGGSISNLFINATQPAMLTLPYLSQFVSKGRAMGLLKDAYEMVRKPETIPDEIKSALAQAEQEGKVGAQEIHHLWQETARPLANSLGQFGEDATYRAHAFMRIWGIPFALAEHVNRQVTFISGYQTAKENGATKAQAYAAAVRAIDETQFIYNKANRPDWARGKVGSVVFTFRLFSLSYTELMIRMLRGNKENRKAALFALGLLFAAAGAQGLPGADDLDDLIDTIGQMLGYNVSSKLAKRKWVEDIAGKELAQVVMYGLSSLTPLDVQGRMSLGNLIPGTGVLKPSNDKKFADILEIVGPAGGLAKAYLNTADAVSTGNWSRASTEGMPKFFKDIAQAYQMASTGEYRDARGRKVQDVDALDALVKVIGFSPQDVSSAGRNIRSVQQEIDFAKRTESLIAEKWARGIVDQDPDAISAAKEELAQWNTRNPETPIGIKLSQVARRANEMRATKEERFLKSATKEMRETVKESIE